LRNIGDPGLLDIIDLKNVGSGNNRASKVTFNDTGNTFAATDSSGNVFVFYITKNRYVNVCKNVYPTAICFTEKYNGLVFLGMPNKTIEVYNLGNCITAFE